MRGEECSDATDVQARMPLGRMSSTLVKKAIYNLGFIEYSHLLAEVAVFRMMVQGAHDCNGFKD